MKHLETQKTTAIFFLFALSIITSAGYSQDILPDERMNPPLFSHPGGFYSQDFDLLLLSGDNEAAIYYTLDGSTPDPENLNGKTFRYKNNWPQNPGDPFGEFFTGSYQTFIYKEPIPIFDLSPYPDSMSRKSSAYNLNPYYFPGSPVYKGIVVRAINLKDGVDPSEVITHTYFINPKKRERYALPVICISSDETNFFDYDLGIYNPGLDFDHWRQLNPAAQSNGGRPANYRRRGDEWEYPAHMSFFSTNSHYPDLSQDIGFRMHGGWSRAYPMKTLRIYGRNIYGESALTYPFFPDQEYDSYKRIILRNSGNDWRFTMFRDALIQKVVSHLQFETLAYQPSVLFLNGEYWGIHNIRERYDKHYLSRVFGVDEDNIDLLTSNSSVIEGDNRHYIETLQYIRDNSLTEPEHYQYIQTRIDTDNFMDYQIANIFAGNTDWPGNNIDYWRNSTDSFEPDSPYGHDGRWRWLSFDMDFGFGYPYGIPSSNHNTLEFATQAGNNSWPNPDWSTFLLRNFLLNEHFRQDFINRFADQLNTAFHPENIKQLIIEFRSTLEPEMPEHIFRWKNPADMGSWHNNVNTIRNYTDKRAYRQRLHIMSHFSIPDTAVVQLDVSNHDHGSIKINTIDIIPETPGVAEIAYPWSGIYFSGTPVRLEAMAKPGFEFTHWEGIENNDSPVIIADPSMLHNIKANFSPLSQKKIIHYWHFNHLSSEPTIDTVYSDYSFHQMGKISYPGTGDGYMDRVNDGTEINLYPEQTPGYGLRVRNPSDTREMIIEAPSEYFENLVLSFATKRTTFGAQDQTLYYSPNNGSNWTAIGDSYNITEDWQLVSFDLTDIQDANNTTSLVFKIVFGGLNADAATGNNRFDNISLTGDPIFESLNFFSNYSGDLSELSTWGRNFDGSGVNPESFELPGCTFHIHNRTQVTLDNFWVVTGAGSRVILGDGENQVTMTIPEQISLTGILDLLDNSTLFLQNDIIPGLGEISSKSTVVFEQLGIVTVPKNSYGKLFVKNGTKRFDGEYIIHSDFEAENASLEFSNISQLNTLGNISLNGIIETISPENFNILISGDHDQKVSANNQDYLEAYNFYAEKTTGGLTLATDIYALNNIRLDIRGNGRFSDDGHLLQLYDDLRLKGDNPDNFSLTGTIKLTAESGTNDIEIVFAELNNLVIDVTGDARPDFLGSGNLIKIKNDFTIKSRSSRPVRFRDKSYHISGDLFIDINTPDQTEEDKSILYFIGNNKQYIRNDGYDGPGLISNIIINNPTGIEISNGSITVDGFAHFQNGIVHTTENNLMKLGPSGMISTYNENSFVNGPFGIYNTGIQKRKLVFPVGKNEILRPVIMSLSHDSSQELLYVVEYINNTPQLKPLSSELSEISSRGYYLVENDGPVNLTQGTISLSYQGDDFLMEDTRIAYLLNDSWENLGANFRDDLPDMVTSVGKLNLPGIFALAKWSGIPDNVDDYSGFNQLNIYPNPASSNSWVRLGETMNVTIINSYGKIIIEKEQIDKINLAGFSPGVYFIRNQAGQTARLVITR